MGTIVLETENRSTFVRAMTGARLRPLWTSAAPRVSARLSSLAYSFHDRTATK